MKEFKEADLVLEVQDLLEFDAQTRRIKVSKDIFDDFVVDTYVNIRFVDELTETQIIVHMYKMISEDNEGIVMECLEN